MNRKLTRQEVARLGGRALVEKRGHDHMKKIGSNGGKKMKEKYMRVPIPIADFAFVERDTLKILCKTANGLELTSRQKEYLEIWLREKLNEGKNGQTN